MSGMIDFGVSLVNHVSNVSNKNNTYELGVLYLLTNSGTFLCLNDSLGFQLIRSDVSCVVSVVWLDWDITQHSSSGNLYSSQCNAFRQQAQLTRPVNKHQLNRYIVFLFNDSLED